MSDESASENGDVPVVLSKPKHLVRIVGRSLLYVWMFGIMVSAPYFNWCYARDHGFTNWLLFGEIVPTFQSMAWPYYVFVDDSSESANPHEVHYTPSGWTKYQLANLQHLGKSLDAFGQAHKLIKADLQRGKTRQNAELVNSYMRVALAEGRQVDAEVIAKLHPELPPQFERLLSCLQLFDKMAKGQATPDDLVSLQKHSREWDAWAKAHPDAIRIPEG